MKDGLRSRLLRSDDRQGDRPRRHPRGSPHAVRCGLRETVVLGPTTTGFPRPSARASRLRAGEATTAFIGQHFAGDALPLPPTVARTLGLGGRLAVAAHRRRLPVGAAWLAQLQSRRLAGHAGGGPSRRRLAVLPLDADRVSVTDGATSSRSPSHRRRAAGPTRGSSGRAFSPSTATTSIVDLDALDRALHRQDLRPARRIGGRQRRQAARARWTAASSPSRWRPATTSVAARP